MLFVLNGMPVMKKQCGAYTLLELIISIILIGILASLALAKLLIDPDKAHEAVAKEFYASFGLGVAYAQAEWQLRGQGGFSLTVDEHTLRVNERGNLIGVDGHEITGSDESSARVCAALADYSHSVLTMRFYPTTKFNFDQAFKEYGLGEEKPPLYQHTFAVFSGKMSGSPVCTYVYVHSLDPVYVIRYFPDRERAVVFDTYSYEDYFSYFSMHTPSKSYLGTGIHDKVW